MVTDRVDLTQPGEMSEEEVKREIDICLEKIQQSFDRFDETDERFLAVQRENRKLLADINARIARL